MEKHCFFRNFAQEIKNDSEIFEKEYGNCLKCSGYKKSCPYYTPFEEVSNAKSLDKVAVGN